MKVATGTVVDGRVVVEGANLTEGSTVTVLLRDDDEAFDLTPEEEAELLESISEIERGEFVSGEDLLERLRRFDDFNLLMIEQPYWDDDIVQHAKLQRELKTSICLDESIRSARDAGSDAYVGSRENAAPRPHSALAHARSTGRPRARERQAPSSPRARSG